MELPGLAPPTWTTTGPAGAGALPAVTISTVHASDQRNFEGIMTCSFQQGVRAYPRGEGGGSSSVRGATEPAESCARSRAVATMIPGDASPHVRDFVDRDRRAVS